MTDTAERNTGQGHTPGPWFFHRDELLHTREPGSHDLIADVDQDGSGLDWKTNEANARLIAAAPDMLEALREIDAWSRRANIALPSPLIYAAIAKAEGKA